MDAFIGAALRELRTEKKYSSEEMAECLSISQSTYSKYENNVYPVPFQIIKTITLKNKTLMIFNAWQAEFFKAEQSILSEMLTA